MIPGYHQAENFSKAIITEV